MEVIHDWDDDQAGAILSAVRRAATPGATVLIIEAVADGHRCRGFGNFADDPAKAVLIRLYRDENGSWGTLRMLGAMHEGARRWRPATAVGAALALLLGRGARPRVRLDHECRQRRLLRRAPRAAMTPRPRRSSRRTSRSTAPTSGRSGRSETRSRRASRGAASPTLLRAAVGSGDASASSS